MTKVLFFTTAIEHTTHRKTAKMLAKEGATVKMVGFTRNNFPAAVDGIDCEVWGEVEHGNYLKRLLRIFNTIFKLRRESKKYDVLYCFTLDALLTLTLSSCFTKKKIVYQVQDIRPIFFQGGIKSKLVGILEKRLLKRINLLVVSSPNYYSDFFKPSYNFPKEKVVVIENKIIESDHHFNHQIKKESDKITIGYFGVLRCPQSWEILTKYAQNTPHVELYIRGKAAGLTNFEEDLKRIPNIFYGGLYTSPDDLAEIYSKVDIVWAAYPYNTKGEKGNWKMARTIRFYESGAFGKPVIVQKDTADSLTVEKYGLGLIVDMKSIENVVANLEKRINKVEIEKWTHNVAQSPRSLFIHNDEYQKLLSIL